MPVAPLFTTITARWIEAFRHTLISSGLVVLLGCQSKGPSQMISQVTAKTASVSGLQIHYAAAIVSNNEPVLVMIHGFGASLETWHDIFPLVSKSRTAIRLDLKGSGLSSKPNDGEYSAEAQAKVVLAFLDKLSLTNVVLIGHSLGGAVAILTHLEDRKQVSRRISGLVLIDSAGYPQALPFFVSSMRSPVTRLVMARLSATFKARYVLNNVFFVKSRVTSERIERYAAYLALPGSHKALAATAKQIIPTNLRAITSQFHTIDVPTLIIWGQNDTVVPANHGRQFHNDIPNSELVILPETGHVPHEERPELVAALIESFVNRLK